MEPTVQSEGKIKTSFKITRAAWRVMMLDKELLGISALRALVGLAILGIFTAGALLLYVQLGGGFTWDSYVEQSSWPYYILLAAFLFTSYAAGNFFAGAISHAALQRFDGENPTFKSALRAARGRVGVLVAYSGLLATVGLVLRIVADRVPYAGAIAVWLTGAAWGVATMFGIPVIMSSEQKNPLRVVKTSATTFKNIWQESVFVGMSLGLIGIVFTIFSIFLLASALFVPIMFGTPATVSIVLLAIFVIMVIVLQLVMSTLHAIVMTAAYHYATTQRVPAGFDEELVRAMFRPKKKWLGV